ncbi:MAG TPA: hypothetical protein VFB44_06005 [Thermoleophilaceae bacterium]|nr:hypothetical protein [Thermoleophilaceae bacterium]
MARILACLGVLLLLALPATALAQSAGDEQYSDPFGKVENGNDDAGGAGGGSGNTTAAPAPSTPAAPAETGVESTETTSTEATGAQLPRTGFPVLLLAGAGALLALSGATLRRRL